MPSILTMGIESSCDETSCSIVRDGRFILSNVIASQADFHSVYGGVVPELASRMHVEAVVPTISKAMTDASVSYDDLSAVCVTKGPGLVGALLVGISAAKGICEVTGLPLVGVGHIEGHISANFLADPALVPPFICLVVSGGHSHIVYVKDFGEYEILARTRDDAAGEAFDKIARAIGLGYPGGPKMDRAAAGGDPHHFTFPQSRFAGSLDFSFSGVKTAALNQINHLKMTNEEIPLADFAASYQAAIVKVLVENTLEACSQKGCMRLCMAGGVSANSQLRARMQEAAKAKHILLSFPAPVLCTDNAAMIASAGYYQFIKGERDDLSMNAYPSLALSQTATAK
ncbi:MAG: tRNA (adenosine(37)-N6)-threonylcarbamoyltransferase complex transferase subunit TsaD [Eubacteriales bacterium]